MSQNGNGGALPEEIERVDTGVLPYRVGEHARAIGQIKGEIDGVKKSLGEIQTATAVLGTKQDAILGTVNRLVLPLVLGAIFGAGALLLSLLRGVP